MRPRSSLFRTAVEAGIVVPKNLAEARAWYAKAAAQGDQRAREQMTRIDRDGPESGRRREQQNEEDGSANGANANEGIDFRALRLEMVE